MRDTPFRISAQTKGVLGVKSHCCVLNQLDNATVGLKPSDPW